MFTTRFWGSTTVLLCVLLLQSCQTNSLRVIEEERPAKTPLQAGWQPSASETLTQPIGYLPSLPSTTAAYQLKVPPIEPSLLPGLSPSTAFEGAPSSMGIHASTSMTPSLNILTAPDPLPLAAMPRASHAVPLRNTPNGTSSSVFTSASGERVRFSQVEGHWRATLPRNNGSSVSQRTLPVVGPVDVGSFLTWLGGQDRWTSRARIHVLHTSQPSHRSCVYLGQAGLLGGMPNDEEDRKLPAKKLRTSEGYSSAARAEERSNRPGDSYAENASAMHDHDARNLIIGIDYWQVVERVPDLPGGDPMAESHNLSLSGSYFGAEEWKRYLGDVGSAPSLPSNIDAILDSPCPFWPAKKVRDTHLLVLIPAAVDGVPFTLNLLGELIQHPNNGGHQTKYSYYDDKVRAQLGAKSADRSYWLLMTREVLEGSRGKSYAEQGALVAGCAKRTDLPYRLPRAREAATAMLTHHARTGERLFGDRPLTYTRCQELASGTYPVVVGGFESSGLPVYYDNFDDDTCGVACCRKLKAKSAVLAETSIPTLAFGALEWKRYLGDVGSVPALPSNIDAILGSPCPFWPGKKVRNTHLLVLIPAAVDGAPFTLNLLGALIQHPKNTKYETKYRCYDGNVKAQLGEKSPDRSYWLLITRMILEGSRNKSYSDQKAWVAGHAKKTDCPYRLPSTLEAATAMLTHHARTGERLFGDSPWTYTRCRELVAYRGTSDPVIVGGFGSSGLFVVRCILYGVSYSGVAGCRQF